LGFPTSDMERDMGTLLRCHRQAQTDDNLC
jgi:hypothetical protein